MFFVSPDTFSFGPLQRYGIARFIYTYLEQITPGHNKKVMSTFDQTHVSLCILLR